MGKLARLYLRIQSRKELGKSLNGRLSRGSIHNPTTKSIHPSIQGFPSAVKMTQQLCSCTQDTMHSGPSVLASQPCLTPQWSPWRAHMSFLFVANPQLALPPDPLGPWPLASCLPAEQAYSLEASVPTRGSRGKSISVYAISLPLIPTQPAP